MPNNEEHAQHSYQRYGYHARDLHQWMDEPAYTYRGSHRRFRHNPDHPPQWAIEKYGFETAQNVMLDHIHLDKKESKRNGISVEFELVNIVDVTTPKGVSVGIVIPEEAFNRHQIQRILDEKRPKADKRKFDNWMLAKARQYGWKLEKETGIPYTPVGMEGKLGIIWLLYSILMPMLGTDLSTSTSLTLLAGWGILSAVTLFYALFVKNDEQLIAELQRGIRGLKVGFDDLEELVLIDDFEEELEDDGYFVDNG